MPVLITPDHQLITNVGSLTATSRGTVLTANAAAHTKAASWTQLVAATTYPACGIEIIFDDCAAAIDYFVDIAFGAGGSEIVVIPNLLVSGGTGSVVYGMKYYFPIQIPAGTRISAKSQASTGSQLVRISCQLVTGGFRTTEGLQIVTAYGIETGDTSGISIDPGGVANTQGAWVQIVASTTYPIRALIIAIGSQKNGTRSSQSWLVRVGMGPGGAEIPVITDYALNCSTSPDIVMPQSSEPIPVQIPAGVRLAIMAQSDGIDATDRTFDGILYALT